MKIWIEEDYECRMVTFWHKKTSYGVETEVPKELIEKYNAVAAQWSEVQQELLKYVK